VALAITIHSMEELPSAAKKILLHFPGKKIFAFGGEMGAGKTTLIKAICSELGVREKAVSPTFAIVNEYRVVGLETNNRHEVVGQGTNNGDADDHGNSTLVFHIDLYRLRNLEEALDIGIDEYLSGNNYCFIEWPELIDKLLPDEAVKVKIEVRKNQERIVTLS